MRLDPEAAAAGFRLATHEVLPSTNAAALHYAFEHPGEAQPLWIVARQQTEGRGRRGNQWVSPPGNLYATLLLINPVPAARAPELSFVAALAVHDAILDRAPMLGKRLALKWPNDVLCDGKKVSGILLEGRMFGDKIAVAVGAGVNCLDHPSHTGFPATDLAAAGAQIGAEKLFTALSATMLRRIAQWRSGAGFSNVRTDWLARAVGIGETLRVRLPDRELVGRGEGLDDNGRLLLRHADGSLHTIAAGEVFPLTRAERELRNEQMAADGAE